MSAIAMIVVVVVIVLLIAMLVAPIRRSGQQRRQARAGSWSDGVGPPRSHAEESRSEAIAEKRL